MTRGIVMMLVAGAGALVLGCSSDSTTPATSQLSFNLTVEADRAMWRAEGLQYQGSVGPYAVYTVTAAQQRLVGPRVILPSQSGIAVLASAQNYFIAGGQGGGAELALECAGKHVVSSPQSPTKDGSCTGPSQSAGNAPTSGADGGAPAPTPPAPASDLGSNNNWGSSCGDADAGSSGGSSGSGGGGWGSGGGGGGYGSGGGGWGGSSGGGSYSNPGGWNNGGWNNTGCGDMGSGTNGGNPPGGNNPSGGSTDAGVPGSSGGGGGSGGSGGSGSGPSDSNGGADVAVSFQHPAPVGSTVLIRSITIHSTQTTRSNDSAPGICCSSGTCSLSSSGHIQ